MKPGTRVFVKTKIREIHPESPIAGKYLIVLDPPRVGIDPKLPIERTDLVRCRTESGSTTYHTVYLVEPEYLTKELL